MTVMRLAEELRLSGWNKSRKILILAARFYRGLETVETLEFAGVSHSDIHFILYSR